MTRSDPDAPSTVSAETAPLFDLDQVGFSYGDAYQLEPLTLRVARGRFTALVGHNGSGKSTLIKLLARQLTASTGTLRYAGRAFSNWSAREFARHFAYLPQTLPATDGLRVKELVKLGRYPWHGALGRYSLLDRQLVDHALSLTGMQADAGRVVDTLSGGERQRAWIAMLVAQGSRCMLLDEPTSALDISHQLDILGLLRTLKQEIGLSVVVVLHDINMAARYADDIIALRSGRLLTRGTPADIMNPQTLSQIFGVPMDVLQVPGQTVPISYPC